MIKQKPPSNNRPTLNHAIVGVACATCLAIGISTFHPPKPPSIIHAVYGKERLSLALNNIRWMKHKDNCFYICTDPNGCLLTTKSDKYQVCKDDLPKSYQLLLENTIKEN